MAQAKTTNAAKKSGGFKFPAILVIILSFIASHLVFHLIFGDVKNFTDATRAEAAPGNYLGIVFLGGFVVPFLMGMLLIVIVFSVERFFSINKAKGKGKIDKFLFDIKNDLKNDKIDAAIAACGKQQGSVANVVQAGLQKYKEMEVNQTLITDQKVINISKEMEEATILELPMLQKNLNILATLASVSTLIALFGTVLGMIRAFAALATSGTPDTAALAQGISEALINTAIGIFASAIAIISYNYFSGLIDDLTASIDEIGFSITQSFASKENK